LPCIGRTLLKGARTIYRELEYMYRMCVLMPAGHPLEKRSEQ
jgi:hypothetical protein